MMGIQQAINKAVATIQQHMAAGSGSNSSFGGATHPNHPQWGAPPMNNFGGQMAPPAGMGMNIGMGIGGGGYVTILIYLYTHLYIHWI